MDRSIRYRPLSEQNATDKALKKLEFVKDCIRKCVVYEIVTRPQNGLGGLSPVSCTWEILQIII